MALPGNNEILTNEHLGASSARALSYISNYGGVHQFCYVMFRSFTFAKFLQGQEQELLCLSRAALSPPLYSRGVTPRRGVTGARWPRVTAGVLRPTLTSSGKPWEAAPGSRGMLSTGRQHPGP